MKLLAKRLAAFWVFGKAGRGLRFAKWSEHPEAELKLLSEARIPEFPILEVWNGAREFVYSPVPRWC